MCLIINHYENNFNFYIDNLTSAEDNLLAVVARAAVGKALINKVLPEDGEDRCKRKADSVYGKKTSAYKSGSIVRCRKGKIWKKK